MTETIKDYRMIGSPPARAEAVVAPRECARRTQVIRRTKDLRESRRFIPS